jgi:hypothetical protein
MGKKLKHGSKFAQMGNANNKKSKKRGTRGGRSLEKEAERFGRWGGLRDPVKLKDAQSNKALRECLVVF